MKLKSKQTGEIMEFDAVLVAKDVEGNIHENPELIGDEGSR